MPLSKWDFFYPDNRPLYAIDDWFDNFDREIQIRSYRGRSGGVFWHIPISDGRINPTRVYTTNSSGKRAFEKLESTPCKIAPKNKRWNLPLFNVRQTQRLADQQEFFSAHYPFAYVPADILNPLLLESFADEAALETQLLPPQRGNRLLYLPSLNAVVHAGGDAWCSIYVQNMKTRATRTFECKHPIVDLQTVRASRGSAVSVLVRHQNYVSLLSITQHDTLHVSVDRVYQSKYDICDADSSPYGFNEAAFVCGSGQVAVIDRANDRISTFASGAETQSLNLLWGSSPDTLFIGTRCSLKLLDTRDPSRTAAILPRESATKRVAPLFSSWARHETNQFIVAGVFDSGSVGLWDVRYAASPALVLSSGAQSTEPFTGLALCSGDSDEFLVTKWSRRFPSIESHIVERGAAGVLVSSNVPLKCDAFTVRASSADLLSDPDPGCYLPFPRSYSSLSAEYSRANYIAPISCSLEGVCTVLTGDTLTVFQLDGTGAVYQQQYVCACSDAQSVLCDIDATAKESANMADALAIVSPEASDVAAPPLLVKPDPVSKLELELKRGYLHDMEAFARWISFESGGDSADSAPLPDVKFRFPLLFYTMPHSLYDFNSLTFYYTVPPVQVEDGKLYHFNNFVRFNLDAVAKKTLEDVNVNFSRRDSASRARLVGHAFSVSRFFGLERSVPDETSSELDAVLGKLYLSGKSADGNAGKSAQEQEFIKNLIASSLTVIEPPKETVESLAANRETDARESGHQTAADKATEATTKTGCRANCFEYKYFDSNFADSSDCATLVSGSLMRYPIDKAKLCAADLVNNVFPVSRCAVELVARYSRGVYDNLDEKVLSDKPAGIPIKRFTRETIAANLEEQQLEEDNMYMESVLSSMHAKPDSDFFGASQDSARASDDFDFFPDSSPVFGSLPATVTKSPSAKPSKKLKRKAGF